MKRVISAINLLEKGHISTFVRVDGVMWIVCVYIGCGGAIPLVEMRRFQPMNKVVEEEVFIDCVMVSGAELRDYNLRSLDCKSVLSLGKQRIPFVKRIANASP